MRTRPLRMPPLSAALFWLRAPHARSPASSLMFTEGFSGVNLPNSLIVVKSNGMPERSAATHREGERR
jgi:hypothetical protein